MKDPGMNREAGTDDERDGIRERPGDLKDDGETRERRRDKGWDPEEDERPGGRQDEDARGGKGESDERGPGQGT
ncbi:hypothetical protein BH23GEM11_BH23GEM11_15580 [soil metagenome]